MSSEEPYDHSGEPLCHYDEKVTENQLLESAEVGDNRVKFSGENAVLYEAPDDEDPNRGYFSKWEKDSEGMYVRVDDISGDVGMCFEKFTSSTL